MEEHDKALTLLAHKLQDYERAKEYCLTYSLGRNRDYRQGLYQTLLQVYLRPSGKEHSTLIRPALSLLNSHGYYFDAAQVLELLPPDWPVATVRAFLLRSLRGSIDTFRTDRIEHSLARGENLQVTLKLLHTHNLYDSVKPDFDIGKTVLHRRASKKGTSREAELCKFQLRSTFQSEVMDT